ncbi:MAG TPA: hypothetical protein VFJ14_02070 [Nocardioidaceae bacterium]|nr:hypothetical protein [Nocardioidaceae bacterium]
MADPGLPTKVAQALGGKMPAELSRRVSAEVTWDIRVVCEVLPLNENDQTPLLQSTYRVLPERGWDMVVCLTELPRQAHGRPLIADVSVSHGVALVSLPALGWLGLQARARDTVVDLVARMARRALGADHGSSGQDRSLGRAAAEWLSPTRTVPSEYEEIETYLALVGLRGRARLLVGMVRNNRPWRLVPSLSSATAAAAAAAAFGIFFASVWGLADALSAWRLALINLVAVVAMAAWLGLYNGLLERPIGNQDRQLQPMLNASTALTLLVGVACMYLLLFVLTLLAALVVISPDFFQHSLRHPVSIADYAKLTWLTTSMGIMAGALGSSLDSEAAVRRAAYSKRMEQHRLRQDS